MHQDGSLVFLKGKGEGYGKDKHADGKGNGYGKTAANESDTVTVASEAAPGWRQRFRRRSRSPLDLISRVDLTHVRPAGRRIMARPKPKPESVDSSDASDESNAGDASASSSAWQCESCNSIAAAELGDRCVRCGLGRSLNDQARVVMSTDERFLS